jgi:DNA-binding transcriptional regulator YdaS (Cro superfamily)
MEMSEIIRRAGGLVKLAKAAGRHHATILGWTRVPPKHVKAVAKATGIPPHELRPDLWDPPAAESPKQEEAA